MFRLNPCQAQITSRLNNGVRVHHLYLIKPASESRKHNAYQHIGVAEFEAFVNQDSCIGVCVQYLRVAEIRFGVTITKVMFRGKEVGDACACV